MCSLVLVLVHSLVALLHLYLEGRVNKVEGEWRGNWVLVLNISQKNKKECSEMVSNRATF